MTTHLTPPRKYRRLMERVRVRDRDWFLAHPGESEYVRPYVPGEAWPYHEPEATHVLVRQIVPGFRTKAFLIPEKGKAA